MPMSQIMQAKCISLDRDLIIRIIENETGAISGNCFSPEFTCVIGAFTLTRSGFLQTADGIPHVFAILSELGLCETIDRGNQLSGSSEFPESSETIEPVSKSRPAASDFIYSIKDHTGNTLVNILNTISARHILLNRALSSPGAFHADKCLIRDCLHHPPVSSWEFLQLLYHFPGAYRRVAFSPEDIRFTGFLKSRTVPLHVRRQLADHLMYAAVTRQWIKPYTVNSRNKKYAMRTWLNSIGMTGDEFAEARKWLLDPHFTQDSSAANAGSR